MLFVVFLVLQPIVVVFFHSQAAGFSHLFFDVS
jgi:hypothetical protein